MTNEEIIDFCEMKGQLEPENEDIYNVIIKALKQELCEAKKIYAKGYADGQRALAEHMKLCKEEKEPCENCIPREYVIDLLENRLKW